MTEFIDTIDLAKDRELAWVRLLMGEITKEAEEVQCKAENGGIELWQLRHMLERHVLKMNMICTMLLGIDNALDKALALAKAVTKT